MPDFEKLYTPDLQSVPEFEPTLSSLVNPFENYNPQPVVSNQATVPGASNIIRGLQQELSRPTLSGQLQPISYDPVATRRDRYTQSDYFGQLGFDPFSDNEEIYGQRQTWGNTIGNALAGGGRLAWQTFVEGWKGWGNMAEALFTWDGSKLVGTDEELAELNREQQEIMNKYAIFETEESRNSIFNRQLFGNMLQQGGFAIGALAQFASEELLTLGLSTAVTGAKLGLNAARMSAAINKAERIKDLKRLGDIWKSDRVVKGILNGARKFVPFADTAADISKYSKAGASAAQLALIGAGGIKRTLAEANMAFTEARMEAAGTYGDMHDKLVNEFRDRTGYQPTGEDLERINDMARAAAEENFAVNSGVLMLSNRLQFDNLFNKFGLDRKVLKSFGEYGDDVFRVTGRAVGEAGETITRVYDKGVLGAAGRFGQVAAEFGTKRAAWEATKAIGKGIFKWEASEGIQELMQESSNTALQDYYYNLYHGAKGYTRGEAYEKAAEDQFTVQGAKTFLMGALTGRLLSPLTFGASKAVERVRIDPATRAQRNTSKQETVGLLNAFYSDPKNFLKEEIANFKAQNAAAEGMSEAAAFQDRYTFHNIKDSAFAKMIAAAKKTDMLESVLDTIRNYGEKISAEEFKEGFGMDVTEDNVGDVRSYFNTIANRVEEYSRAWETLHDKYSDLVMPELYQEGTPENTMALIAQKALNDAIEILATNKFKAERAIIRAQELQQEVGKNPNIGNSSLEAFRVLGDENKSREHLALLKSEIAAYKSNPAPDAATRRLLAQKEEELQYINDFLEGKDGNKEFDAFEKFINLKNREANLNTTVNRDDVREAFGSLADYIALNRDHAQSIEAYNTLANPVAFAKMHAKMVQAITEVKDLLEAEHAAELAKANQQAKEVTTIVTNDENGNPFEMNISEGDLYVTAASEDNVIFQGKVAKTFNNNLIEIVKIDGDNITIRVNNDKTYTVSKERLANAGRLWNLNDMSVDERIYFKNRDMVLKINVRKSNGKPHLNTGKFSDQDYSKIGTVVNARLVLAKEDGKNVLKIQYVNPVTKKTVTMNYSADYLKKYGVDKINLRTLPTEEQELERKNKERLGRNFESQLKIFNERVDEATAQLNDALVEKETNKQRFEELRQKLMNDRAHLELVIDELAKYDGKKGRKSNLQKELTKLQSELVSSIADAQTEIDAIKAERSRLEVLVDDLERAKSLYEDIVLDLEINQTPFDRAGGQDLSSNTQDQYDRLIREQTSRRLDPETIDNLVQDTEAEIEELNDKVRQLEGYIRDVTDLLKNVTTLSDFLTFQDLPENTTNRAGLREYLRKRIAAEQDPAVKDDLQKLMNQVVKGGKEASDILFLLSSLRDSLKELQAAEQRLAEIEPKAERLRQAQAEKRQLSELQDRIAYLNQIQQILIEDQGKVRPESTPVATAPKAEGQEDMESDTDVESDPNAITFSDVRKPKFEEIGFNKTFGRHYLDENDTELNTADGSDRFFGFTAKQNVKGQGYQLQVVTANNDTFGIRQSDINPDDIKVVLMKPVQNADGTTELKYVGEDGNVLENPSKDNIIYRSLVNVNNLTPARIRSEYTVAEGTTDEDIQKKIDQQIAYQKDLVARTAEGPVYLNAVSTSPGVQRVERLHDGSIAQAEVEGRVIEDNPDWTSLKSANNPENGIELRISTANGAIAPGILPGRAVMQEFTYGPDGKKVYGDKITRVFNRELSEAEKETVTDALVRLTALFGRKNAKAQPASPLDALKSLGKKAESAIKLTEQEQAEYNLIMNYLKNVLCWGTPKNEGNPDRFFYIQNGLNRGKFKVPFTEKGIRDNATALFDGVFHHINNRTLQKNEEFSTIKFKDGKAVPAKTYATYTEYLLAKREEGVPPVYTSLPRVDSGTPQRTNAYLNWVDPTVKVEQEAPKQKAAPTPAPSAPVNNQFDQDIEDFVSYKKKAIRIKDVDIAYRAQGSNVVIEFKKGDQTKSLPPLESVDQILRNADKIRATIYEATGYNPKTAGLAALAAKATVRTSAPAQNTTPANPLAALAAKAKIQTEATQAAPQPAVRPQNPLTAPVVEKGETKYFTIHDAVNNAVPKAGKLSAAVWTKNVVTGETRKEMEASVQISDGKVAAARILLTQELTRQIPNVEEEEPFRLTLSEFEGSEDFKAFESFMKENLPQIPVKKVGELIHGKAWGAFINGAVYIYENAEIGTGFHEAFESVWATYLPEAEQQQLADEFRKRKGSFYNPFTKTQKDYSDASDYDVREVLAEEFRRYVLDNNNQPADKKIKSFFKKLWDFIQKLLGLNTANKSELNSQVNKLFKKISTGGFRNLSPIRESSSQLPVYRAVAGLSQEETADVIEGLSYYFFLELYKNGGNIDSLLNGLNPIESNQLLNNLYDLAHQQVVANTGIIGTGLQTMINEGKMELYNEFKKSISRYGLDFEEDPDLTKEETTTDALGIRDSISIDPKKMSAVNVKLMISSLPASTYNKQGTMVMVRNSMNQPKLSQYDRVHTILLNELSNITTRFDADGKQIPALDLMIQHLENKYRNPRGFYKEGFTWIRNLKLRLKYEDINGVRVPQEALNVDDVMLQVAFIKSFTNVKTIPQKTIVGEDGYVYNLNPIDNGNLDRVKTEWSNALKQSLVTGTKGLLDLAPDGTMTIDRNSQQYRDLIGILDNRAAMDLDRTLDALEMLGIQFSAPRVDLRRYESTIRENTIQILEQIKGGQINTVTDLYGNNIIGGRINQLLNIEAGFTAEENVLSYLNANGQSQYSVGIPSLLSNVINTLNSVSSLKELVQTAPWLGNVNEAGEPVLFGYQANSELLKKGGILFDNKGNRRQGAKIDYQVISGVGTSDFDGTSTDQLQFPERVANKIHYLLNNTVYSNINSDKSTEFGIGIPGKPLVSITDVQNLLYFGDSPVTDLYIRELTDEMFTALQNAKNPSNVQYYKDQVESLGHFRGILGGQLIDLFKKEVLGPGAKYKASNAHEQFIAANRGAISEKINEYLTKKADQTVKFLIDLDIFTKPAVAGNDMYITDAIDNDALVDILKVPSSQTISIGMSEGEMVQRQGFTETDVRTLAGFLAFNEEALITEQHKLIYGHPAFYKDLPKRANGATSTKEQMVDDVTIINWLDENMQRNDGKQRSAESHQTIKVISFADQNVVSNFYKDIAEGMYQNMVQSGESKSVAETKVGAKFDKNGNLKGFITTEKGGYTGLIKAYLELNEADAMAWGMPDAIRDMLFLTGKLTKQQQGQWDFEIAYEKVALAKKGLAKYSKEELAAAQAVVDKGDPGYVFQVLKPQYFGYAQNPDMMQPVFLKHAVQPKFYRHVEGTQYEKLYLASKRNNVDIIGFESGEKVGNVTDNQGGFVSLYNDNGEVNVISNTDNNSFDLPAELPQQKLYSKFYGIQVETSAKPKTEVVRGTQVSKLIMVNYYENGQPINEKVGATIAEYNKTMVEMMRVGKQNLLRELGLEPTETGYRTNNLVSLVKTLRREAESRDLPDNMIEAIDALMLQDGSYALKYKFDTLINREKIDNILNSIVDSRVISEKIHGAPLVQVASTLYESNPRDFMYLKDGVYTQLNRKDIAKLTPDERASIKMKSSDLKFYKDVNGKIQSMEVYLNWPFKYEKPEDFGLVLQDGIYKNPSGTGRLDPKLLKALGFRIPTQAMNSIESIEIKGFTPRGNGDMIVVPSEIVGKSGSDFDIDKLNVYLANYYVNGAAGKIEYIEWKGSYDKTKAYYEDLYDKGQLLSAEDAQELDRYIAEEQDILGNESEDRLLKAIFHNLFTEEQLTKEFLDSLTGSQRKDRVVESLVKKALQNHFINTMNELVQFPENYRQLVVPNGVDNIKSIADDITKLKIEAGTKTKEDEKSFTFLRTFIGNSQIRERYLTAKRMVGIAALHSTFHSMAQVSGTKLRGYFATKDIYYLTAPNERLRTVNVKLTHNPKTAEGEFNIGARTDAAGLLISERMSEKLSGFVDGAKDPFVFDLNLNMNTSSTWFYLDHLGVPEEEIAYLFNQPIMDEFFAEQAKNRSGFKRINGTNLNKEQLFYKVTAPYFKKISGRDILAELKSKEQFPKIVRQMKKDYIAELNKINAEFPVFKPEQMREAIRAGKSADPKLQIAALINYLEHTAQAGLVSNYIKAIGYDNSKTRTVQENMIQVATWERSKEQDFIANPDAILENTFIGEMKKQKEDIFNMFKDFFVTLTPQVQPVFKRLEDQINNPDWFATKDDQIQLLNRYQNYVITYLLHTTQYNENEKTIALNNLYEEFFRGQDSMARTLNRLKKSADPNISQNLVIRELLPLMNEDVTKTDNISLFRNRIDTYQINNLIEALDNLKSYAEQTADEELLTFVNNLAKFSILQSGMQNSSIDYKKVLSTSVYSDLVKNILDHFTESSAELDADNVWRTFHQNNWSNRLVVPKAPNWLRLKNNKAYVGENSSLAANDYIMKYAKKPGITKAKMNQMRKEKRIGEAFQPVLLEKKYLTENGQWVYEPINRLGDGFRMTEIYTDDRPSILPKNGDVTKDFEPAAPDNEGWIKITLPKFSEEGTPVGSEDVDTFTSDYGSDPEELKEVLNKLDQGCKKKS